MYTTAEPKGLVVGDDAKAVPNFDRLIGPPSTIEITVVIVKLQPGFYVLSGLGC